MLKNRSLRRRLGALGAGAALLLAGCGEGVDALDQPHIGGERFVEIRFEDLPRPEGSTTKSIEQEGLLQTELFDAPEDMDVVGIFSFYTSALGDDGWEEKDELQPILHGGLASWEKAGRTVLVQAVEVPADAGADPNPTSVTLTFQRLDQPG